MRIQYANLAVILAVVGMIRHCWPNYTLDGPISLGAVPNIAPTAFPVTNSEATFALNKRIKLSDADLYDLELIPRLSEVVALRILAQRAEIIASASNIPQEAKYQALTEVRGIGKVTAQKLGSYLVLE